jgi:RNA polymerase sigma-70 factor (ECF subfamily)
MSEDEKDQDFANVVDAYYERILRGALSVTRDQHLAEELAQETFLLACRKFHSFSGRSSVFTWLYRIMLNSYCRHVRKKMMQQRLGLIRVGEDSSLLQNARDEGATPSAKAVSEEEKRLLMHAMEQLPTKLRVIIAMHYFDGLTLKEIAEVSHCRVGTVKSRIYSARQRLCHRLQGLLDYEHRTMPRS